MRLRMQRRRHVDARDIIVVAAEGHIFGAGVGTDPRQKLRKADTGPFADRAPTLDADMPSDLREPRQGVKFIERPGLVVLGQSGDVEMEIRWIDNGGFVLRIIGVEGEGPA